MVALPLFDFAVDFGSEWLLKMSNRNDVAQPQLFARPTSIAVPAVYMSSQTGMLQDEGGQQVRGWLQGWEPTSNASVSHNVEILA